MPSSTCHKQVAPARVRGLAVAKRAPAARRAPLSPCRATSLKDEYTCKVCVSVLTLRSVASDCSGPADASVGTAVHLTPTAFRYNGRHCILSVRTCTCLEAHPQQSNVSLDLALVELKPVRDAVRDDSGAVCAGAVHCLRCRGASTLLCKPPVARLANASLAYRRASPHCCSARLCAAALRSVRNPPGDELSALLASLGPTFVKLGQTLSTREDLIGKDVARKLSALQMAAPPFDDAVAYALITSELGAEPQQLYGELSASPVAAASLGQVYRGTVEPGHATAPVHLSAPDASEAAAAAASNGAASRESTFSVTRARYARALASSAAAGGDRTQAVGEWDVAVKVQRPDLLGSIALDVYVLRLTLGAVRRLAGINSDIRNIADEVGRGLFAELDYRVEASQVRCAARVLHLELSQPKQHTAGRLDHAFVCSNQNCHDIVNPRQLHEVRMVHTSPPASLRAHRAHVVQRRARLSPARACRPTSSRPCTRTCRTSTRSPSSRASARPACSPPAGSAARALVPCSPRSRRCRLARRGARRCARGSCT